MSPRTTAHMIEKKHAKLLLKCCDALPDGTVFDTKLQVKVLQKIIGQDNSDRSGAFRIVRTKSFSAKNLSRSDVLNAKDIVTHESTRAFFSEINSEKTLRLVINTIFDAANEPKAVESFQKNCVYDKIWELYKHTDDKRKEKEEARVEGNHVRKVVKPMEARIKKEMAEIKAEMKKMAEIKAEMKQEMGEMKQEMKEKMDRILALLEKR